MTTDPLRNLRVLLLGCNGQLGTELSRILSKRTNLTALDFSSVDFREPDQLRKTIREARPDVVFNAAAYTAVDRAESEKDLAFQLNATAPRVIAQESNRISALLIHYSTDYVFDGSKPSPYTELDSPSPLNVYGRSKLEGERLIQRSGCRHLIFRISWLYAPHGKNFYLTIRSLAETKPELRIVDDQHGSPTSAAAVAAASTEVLQVLHCFRDLPTEQGIFHMTGRGNISWCEFARSIIQRIKLPSAPQRPKIVAIRSDEYLTAAKRPLNSVMDSSNLFRAFGVRLPSWQKQLDQVVSADPSIPRSTTTANATEFSTGA
jgi:dTDP-4-dehydrorhamnose reductase